MVIEIQGGFDGEGLSIGVVVAKFNQAITSRLLQGTKRALSEHGVVDDKVTIVHVPGSFDVPLVAKKMSQSQKFDAIICLGAVIAGETDHHLYVSQIASQGIWQVSIESGIPVVFGILTVPTLEHAFERSGGEQNEGIHTPRVSGKGVEKNTETPKVKGNSGYNVALAALELANLLKQIESL